ncbi:MAG: type II secretion system protein [Planctomycetota bacterium]
MRNLQTVEDNGFTLVEIITVVAIIILLIGMLFPVLRGAMEKAKITQTTALVTRLDAALYRYQSDWRDYPPSTALGGAAADLPILRTALLSEVEPGGPYENFNDKETGTAAGLPAIVDAWKHPILYCHFAQYDPVWPAWRANKKKYEFQLVSPGRSWEALDTDKSGFIENGELAGTTDADAKNFIKNW